MNILLTLLGWLAWNFGLFSYEKDKADDMDQPFPIGKYIGKYWDNWVLSLLIVPILIIAGIKGLHLEAIPIGDFKGMKWSDAYYLAAGPLAEILKYYTTIIIKKYKAQ